MILCTGFTHNLDTFSDELKAQYELPSEGDTSPTQEKLDAWAAQKVDNLLPVLKNPPNGFGKTSRKRPCRLYRQLISPHMAARGDRSIYFPGLIHSVYTPLVSELQALWGVAYMLDRLDLPDLESMLEQTAVWNAWTSKRYLEQGRKHAYSIYDYIAVRYFSSLLCCVHSLIEAIGQYIDTLARDLGIKTNRKSNPISEMFATYRPRDYRGLIDEFLKAEALRIKLKPDKNILDGATGKR